MQWDLNDPEKTFVFVDGGVTPYNNPAFLLYRMATQTPFRLNWETGEDKLQIISVGRALRLLQVNTGNIISPLINLPTNLMYAYQNDQDITCRTIGRCIYGITLDREIESLMDDEFTTGSKSFSYVRYNIDLSQENLNELGLSHIDSDQIRNIDSVKYIDQLKEVGQFATSQVSIDHFKGFA